MKVIKIDPPIDFYESAPRYIHARRLWWPWKVLTAYYDPCTGATCPSGKHIAIFTNKPWEICSCGWLVYSGDSFP